VAAPTIVLIEDDDGIRETLAALLEDEGYNVAQASNGIEGLMRMSEANELCLVLLDLWMPLMNGWQLLVEMRRDPVLAEVPVVVISAAGDQQAPAEAAAFLRKPLKLEALLEAVAKHRRR
jgi:CheY-like chemotaxis protein